eukprot:snap_masked-scaffold_79-processed-gene-0.13-mRNA-1 protein AED:0.11 eAED:1.00 QI:0/0/0/0.5/1/1/2/0/328
MEDIIILIDNGINRNRNEIHVLKFSSKNSKETEIENQMKEKYRLKKTCESCAKLKIKCTGKKVDGCSRCRKRGEQCVFLQRRKRVVTKPYKTKKKPNQTQPLQQQDPSQLNIILSTNPAWNFIHSVYSTSTGIGIQNSLHHILDSSLKNLQFFLNGSIQSTQEKVSVKQEFWNILEEDEFPRESLEDCLFMSGARLSIKLKSYGERYEVEVIGNRAFEKLFGWTSEGLKSEVENTGDGCLPFGAGGIKGLMENENDVICYLDAFCRKASVLESGDIAELSNVSCMNLKVDQGRRMETYFVSSLWKRSVEKEFNAVVEEVEFDFNPLSF